MPKGCFVLLLLSESEYKVLGYFFKEPKINFEVTSDLFLRLNLDHSKNEYNLLKLKDIILISYIHKFKGKLVRKAFGLIVGLLLNKEDNPEKFRTSLKKTAEAIESINILEISKEDFEQKLKEIYNEQLESFSEFLKADILKESIINRTKELLSGSKKDRKIAQDLLEKIEENEHIKISENYRIAENALKTFDYEKAAKFFEKAAETAKNLLEKDLAATLKEKASIAGKIPTLTKNLDEVVQKARNFLKNENFNSAYIWYKKASEIAKELMLTNKEEEYRLKSKALQDFHQI
ncbi:MAG: hypothetical protein ACTSQJ_17735, partial [Promethearchaeota archaeon]